MNRDENSLDEINWHQFIVSFPEKDSSCVCRFGNHHHVLSCHGKAYADALKLGFLHGSKANERQESSQIHLRDKHDQR